MRPLLARALEMSDQMAAFEVNQPISPWHWGPALLGYARARLQDHLGDQRYTETLVRWVRHHARGHGPRIVSSDTAAPGLITFELERLGWDEFRPLTDRVVEYLRQAPRIVGPAVNHLGTSIYSRLYPRSVWVDTLMMYGVFPARVGRARNDMDLVDRAATLPVYCAKLLQHPDGLWSHSYWTKSWCFPHGRQFPRATMWARGNGWVVAAIPMVLDEIGDHPARLQLREIWTRTCSALREVQRDDGSWSTVLNGKSRGRPETSATALIAAGWLHGIDKGYLAKEYLEPARRAVRYVESMIVDGAATARRGLIDRWLRSTAAAAPSASYQGPAVIGVSGPTIPTPLVPRLAYTRLTPDAVNASYGMASVILAAIADDLCG